MSIHLPQPVFVLSDGTGDTAEKVVRAAFRQFRGHVIYVRTFPLINSSEKLSSMFRRAQRQSALVVTTLVQPEMRAASDRLSRELGVRHIDLLGHLIVELEGFLDQKAIEVPGLMHLADETYFRRIEAVEFTIKCDDGKEPRMLMEADLILVGVSRTSKTPLSTFLAHKGYKVANVPLVLDKPPPDQLFEVDQKRVFALTIQPGNLHSIRQSRLKHMRMNRMTNYGDIDYILAELEFADELFAANPEWPVLNVTNKAVEESAATILAILFDRGELPTPAGESGQL